MIIVLGACTDRAPEPGPERGSAQLPRIEFVTSLNIPGSEDVRQSTTIALGPGGEVLFPNTMSTHYLQMVGQHLPRVVAFARMGDGPGEIRAPRPIFISESLAVGFDLANLRLSYWNFEGVFRRSVSLSHTPVVDFAAGRTSEWILRLSTPKGMTIGLLDDTSGEVRTIVPPSDSFLSSEWPDAFATAAHRPAIGQWTHGVAVGNPRTYRVGLYDWNGNLRHVVSRGHGDNLPTETQVKYLMDNWRRSGRPGRSSEAERQEIFWRQPQPWFKSRIKIDGHGRYWLVGIRGDTTVADVFYGANYVGSVSVDCHNPGESWDINRDWLSIICDPPDTDDRGFDAVVKLFRIIETQADNE